MPIHTTRLNVNITKEQQQLLSKNVPHGFRTRIFGAIVDLILKELETNGSSLIKAALDGKIRLHYED